MKCLYCNGSQVASVEIADTFMTRLRGLIGRRQAAGAMLITKSSSVHTFGMRFPIDVAFCDESMLVLDVIQMRRRRASLPRRGAKHVVEAVAGSFQAWHLEVGSRLEIKESEST